MFLKRDPARGRAKRTSLDALALLAALLCPFSGAGAQEPLEEVIAEETPSLAEAAQNPVADLISLPLQNNMNLTVGDRQVQNVLNVQPVIPVGLGDGVVLLPC